MTEPAAIPRPTRRADYIPIVKAMRPWMPDEEADVRASLLLFRDRAMATKQYASAPAWPLLDVVEQIASENAMNYLVPLDQLRELRRLCSQCAATARDFDMIYQPNIPGLDHGEAHAKDG